MPIKLLLIGTNIFTFNITKRNKLIRLLNSLLMTPLLSYCFLINTYRCMYFLTFSFCYKYNVTKNPCDKIFYLKNDGAPIRDHYK